MIQEISHSFNGVISNRKYLIGNAAHVSKTIMEKLETKNKDLLLQRRSLESILDDTLNDLTVSLKNIECSFQLLKDFQNQRKNEERHFSSQKKQVRNLEQKLEEDQTNVNNKTRMTSIVGSVAGVAAPLLFMSGPIGLITAGVGLVTTIASTSEVIKQGDMLIDEDKKLLRGTSEDLEETREKINWMKRCISHEERQQDDIATSAKVRYNFYLHYFIIIFSV